MTTLYIAPGACSFAAHVLVHELELPIPVESVTLRTPDASILKVNPLGRVPALQLENGTLITENVAILPFLADLRPGTPLFAEQGSVERAQIQSWLGYFATELHSAAFRPLNRPERYSADEQAHPGIRAQARIQLFKALEPIDRHLAGKDYLVGGRFTIADAYLGVFAGWIGRIGGEFEQLRELARFSAAYRERPSVQRTLKAEGF
ncbi:glutathione S-transferase C-terminal domain-containing protein [Pseudomonas citronellolis]|uniref:glutathione S-transferase C-terminal domain-containing protein n=1 Tax=Pseudomonas citronellolis TaxID=53408 RepID=UPI0023E3A31F|nr:glutathione S-transferase C-terminal domain-containing protein [Pseudomonas citronellolis]MDF3935837.1 glutathione S-transferase C-terminal domain-containing protein [Pseudomonas citronellolis]